MSKFSATYTSVPSWLIAMSDPNLVSAWLATSENEFASMRITVEGVPSVITYTLLFAAE